MYPFNGFGCFGAFAHMPTKLPHDCITDFFRFFHVVRNTTIKYIPASTVSTSPPQTTETLNGGDIAGIVIGCLIFVGLVCVCAVGYIAYRRRVSGDIEKDIDFNFFFFMFLKDGKFHLYLFPHVKAHLALLIMS